MTQTPTQTPDQTSSPVTDLDAAPDGTAPSTATATSIPEDSGEGGIILTRRDGDLGWQLATQNNRPANGRHWHAADNRWRSWKRFDDARNTERATAAAIRTAVDTPPRCAPKCRTCRMCLIRRHPAMRIR